MILAAALVSAGAAWADGGSAGLADALGRDSETELHVRTQSLDRNKNLAPDSYAWAAGGWLGYRSGWLGDALRLGLTAYASEKIAGPADQDGTALLLAGQRSYSVLGESYGALKVEHQVLTAGRFLINQFEVNPQDTRMTPRTYQGAALTGTLAGIDYFVGRFDKMKHRNWDYFEAVATVAGAPASVAEPLWLLSLRAAPRENLNLGFSSYRVRDVLAASYAEIAWLVPASAETQWRLGGQYMRQGSTGNHVLTGAAFDTWIVGFKADLIHGPFTLSGIVMQTDRGAAYRTPFGSWIGYTSRIINNFNRAGERARAVDAVVDFASLGAPGLSLTASATRGDAAINAATGARLSRNSEYDLTADYKFTAAHWPAWARTLALRARWGRFEQRLGNTLDVTTERHLILNYAVTFK